MSFVKNIKENYAVSYVYDGSFDGFLCCVYESVYSSEKPFSIVSGTDGELSFAKLSFAGIRNIETDIKKAAKVDKSIYSKISPDAADIVSTVFLSNMENKETRLLEFLFKGYECGRSVVDMFGDPIVQPVLKAYKYVHHEAHQLKGFLRFADCGEVLVSSITPNNFILPFISDHFARRFPDENFIIYDKMHNAAFIYQKGKRSMFSVDSITFPPYSEQEVKYRNLWKHFYNTVAISSRYNPKCRMTHLPKRFWADMVELRDELTLPELEKHKKKIELSQGKNFLPELMASGINTVE